MPVCAGFSGLLDFDLCCHLRSADPVGSDFRGCNQFHLEHCRLHRSALFQPVQDYVWGGSTPETGFDCSGYVCWVYNQNGYNVGRTTANGLWNKSQHISEAEAKPGDLVFFKGTYDTPGMSHTGIYLGNGMMVSAGDPIKYANIHSSYWEKHLAGFGRLSK